MTFEPEHELPHCGEPAGIRRWEPPPYLGRLENCGGAGMLVELIEAFRSDTGERLQRLQDAFADADLTRVSREAHSIKGSCGQMGASEMVSLCQLIELAASNRLAEQVERQMKRLETSFAEVCSAMAAYCAAESAGAISIEGASR